MQASDRNPPTAAGEGTHDPRPGDVAIGEVLAERFVVERVAGEGGMGQVFQARDLTTGRPVAVKVLWGGRRQEQRFDAEIQLARELRHPRLAQFVGSGQTRGGRPFLAIEWLEGSDLADRLRLGPLSVAESVELGAGLAEVLSYLHERGLIHRDLKPSNVFLLQGKALDFRLLDFGIARQPDLSLTATGELLGTPAYMSPEQARGENTVDGRADLFSLGCLLFECLTGRPSFQGTNPVAILAKILWEPTPRLAGLRHDIDAELDHLIGALMAKNPEQRPTTAKEVATRLRGWRFSATAAAEPSVEGLTQAESRLVSVVLVAPVRLMAQEPELSSSILRDTTVSDAMVGSPLLRRLTSLSTLARRFGGDLQPLANGALVVTIGGAGVATDRAMLAARCSLAIAREVSDLSEGIFLALATGRADLSGRLPVGAVIDRAARMLRGKPSRGVRVDEVTAGLLDGRFDLRGFGEAFELAGELPNHGLLRPVLGKPSPLVGRDRELELLVATCREAAEDREARAIVVLAPPGGGKSRLLAEMAQRVERQSSFGVEGCEIWRGRADPVAVGAPYQLLASALRHAAAWQEGDSAKVHQAKLRARLARHLTGDILEQATLFLSECLGSGDLADPRLEAARRDATLMSEWVRLAWQNLFEAETRQGALILLLEDLQWGDLPSVQTLDHALERLWDRPLVVIAAGRPETSRVFSQLWSERATTTLKLSSLSRRASDQLLRALLEGAEQVDAELLGELAQRSGGNPFFLEELARAVRERPAEWRAGPALASLPETILAMIQVRAESLDALQRRVLRAASLFGSTCWRSGIAALLGEGGIASHPSLGSPTEALAALVQLEILEELPTSRFPGDTEFSFRHALFREAAYASLTPADRQLGHRLVGQWLQKAGESSPLVLAEHFDRSDRPELAAGHFAAAAEWSLQSHDLNATLELATRGLRHVLDPAVRGRLELVASEAHRWRGELATTQNLATAAVEHLPPGEPGYFRALGVALEVASRRGDRSVAPALIERVLVASSQPASHSAHLACLALAARQVFHEGRYAEADTLVAAAEALAHREGIADWALAELYRLRGARARHRGDLAGDLAGYAAALAAFESCGDRRQAANTRVSLGFTYLELGEAAQGEALLERARSAAQELGLGNIVTRAEQNLGLAKFLVGDFAAAATLLERVIAAAAQRDDRRFEGWTRIYLANTRLAQGDSQAAIVEASRAAELLRPAPPALAGALAALARALVQAARPVEAKQPAAEAIAILHEQGGIEEFESLVWLAWIETLDHLHETVSCLAAARHARLRLAERAHAISDPDHRHSFLEQVPENRSLTRLLASLGC